MSPRCPKFGIIVVFLDVFVIEGPCLLPNAIDFRAKDLLPKTPCGAIIAVQRKGGAA
jgi:hypothetical protein